MDGTNLQGLAAEHLVASDLCRQGYAAYLVASHLQYDVVVDVAGRLLRVQVKSCKSAQLDAGHKHPCYKFRIGKHGRQKISSLTADVVALVASDTGHIAYLSTSNLPGYCLKLRPAGSQPNQWSKKAYNIDELPFSKLLQEMTI